MDDRAQLFPNYLLKNGPFTSFNHAYVLLSTDPAQHQKGAPISCININGQNIKKHILLSRKIRV